MPFGIKEPLSYSRRDNVQVIHPDSYEHCQVCGKETAPNEDGYVPIAAIVVPAVDDFSGFRAAYLVCANCYSKQKRLNFKSMNDLREHVKSPRGSSRGRPRGSVKGAIDLISVRLGHTTLEPTKQTKTRATKSRTKRLADCANPLIELVNEIEEFGAYFSKQLGMIKAMILEAKLLEAKREIDEPKIEESEVLGALDEVPHDETLGALDDDIDPGDTRETADEDLNDDDDFGMTDEQRARFAALKNRTDPVLPAMAPPEVDTSDW